MWLIGKTCASIEGIGLLPQENTFLPRNPLVVARGQAQAFYLHDENKRVWILKKFLPGRNPDAHYIKAIQALVPQNAGFEAGYQRKVLSRASVAPLSSPSPDFPSWIENTILMPLVKGSDWAYIADKVRDGKISLTPEQRLLLCRNLSEKVSILERNNLSHRDLSSTNVFVDTNTWNVHLIDWDSIFHSSLTLPPNTTFGTNGYVAPFVRVNGSEDPHITWTCRADRFSMAVLNVEFLSVERDSPVTGDGGLLDQDEIYRLGGNGISKIAGRLQQNFPDAFGLFDKILRAKNFSECPSPDKWRVLGAGVTAPSLKDVYDPQADFLKFIQRIQKPIPVIAAPKLSEIEVPNFNVSYVPATKDAGPPAPSLADMETIDARSLLPHSTKLETAWPAPSLAEIQDADPRATPPTSTLSASAPRLAEIEDPLLERNKKTENKKT